MPRLKPSLLLGDELMKLASPHWDYIDRFAPKLVARADLPAEASAGVVMHRLPAGRLLSFDGQ
jgi:hypothetical protein